MSRYPSALITVVACEQLVIVSMHGIQTQVDRNPDSARVPAITLRGGHKSTTYSWLHVQVLVQVETARLAVL
ncbi:hypothetical protein LY78DRAFT_350204 [Colletotrichum sublineola]|nr:hypothetical protein LY78DRAFT_350204 [Colletotrichum sublineola]